MLVLSDPMNVHISRTPYAYPHSPLGFHAFQEYGLGNGDYFGVYWPIGHEEKDPIVCETIHDDGLIVPFFSNLRTFLEASNQDDDWFEACPTLEDDPLSPWALLNAARALQEPETLKQAVKLLEQAVTILPEYAEAQRMLSNLYFRMGDYEKSFEASLQGFISSPSFGGGHNWEKLSKYTQHFSFSDAQLNIPIIKNGLDDELTFDAYGKKENNDYIIFKDTIKYFEEIGDFVRASTFAQTYAEHMNSQNIDFQQRYGFDLENHIQWQRELAKKLPCGTRELSAIKPQSKRTLKSWFLSLIRP